MLRGDDVRELQTRLNQLGFDTGKVDAIFGPNTQAALMTFQRDAGISADGICGPATTLHLRRLGHLADGSITSVRELESIAATPRTFKARRIFVAARIHGAPSAAQLCNQLVELGANVACSLDLTHDAGAAIPAAEFDADLCVLIQPTADRDWRTAFYGSGRYRSFRGEAIAVAIARRLSVDNYGASSGTPNRAVPLQLGFLRETRMPAVVVQTTSESNAPSDETSMIAFGIKDGFEQPAPFSQ